MSVIEQCNSCRGFSGYCSLTNESNQLCDSYEPPIDNSGLFRHLFSYKGRIRRYEYFLSNAFYLIFYLPFALLSTGDFFSKYSIFSFILSSLFLVICVGWNIVLIFQGIKRCHDVGYSGWFILIPLFNPFYLLFVEGNDGVNEYGSNPKQNYKSQVFDLEEYQENIRNR